MFVKAESWEQALSCFKACKNWRQIFCMTARLKYSPDKEMDIAKKLTGNLTNNIKGVSDWFFFVICLFFQEQIYTYMIL